MEPKSYKFKIWKEGSTKTNPICVSIENPQTGTKVGFTDWGSLLTFLNQQAEEDHLNRPHGSKLFDTAH